jgi:putative hydrolase of the HAD superfamily
MTLRGIFFDLDGTLTDVRNREVEVIALPSAWRETFGTQAPLEPIPLQQALNDAYQSGFAYGTSGYAELAHLSTRDLSRRLLSSLLDRFGVSDQSPLDRCLDLWAEAQRAALVTAPGAIEALETLRAAGLTLGVITNGPSSVQREKLALLALEPYFDCIVVDSELGYPKPDRRIFEHATASVGLTAAEMLFVGDTPSADIGGARGAGWTAVWYNPRGEAFPSTVEQPHHVIQQWPELLGLPSLATVLG